jgi:hypothetical protein
MVYIRKEHGTFRIELDGKVVSEHGEFKEAQHAAGVLAREHQTSVAVVVSEGVF